VQNSIFVLAIGKEFHELAVRDVAVSIGIDKVHQLLELLRPKVNIESVENSFELVVIQSAALVCVHVTERLQQIFPLRSDLLSKHRDIVVVAPSIFNDSIVGV